MTSAKEIMEGMDLGFPVNALIEALGAHGYVVVPKEPTPQMIEAGFYASGHEERAACASIYRAMIGAVAA